MKKRVIVITGSTEGIGYGLAHAFLTHGCRVVVSSRTPGKVAAAAGSLSAAFEASHVLGQVCDVTDPASLQALWDAAVQHFGAVDIWINNAGRSHASLPAWQLEDKDIQGVIATNLTGMMLASKIAVRGMLAQGYGFVYNMEGLGSDGRVVPNTAVYGSSKSAVRYFTRSLEAETKNTCVRVGRLSPGMVLTDLLVGDAKRDSANWEQNKRIFNILADTVETVTPYLARKVLDNQKHGARIQWLTTGKVAWRFLTAAFHRRDFFDESNTTTGDHTR
ncbi:MAG: SDR family oxidoreductase [Anaerolineae bacterium]|nr:SDR family oxidoreductase [Anaerolineae bacterium]